MAQKPHKSTESDTIWHEIISQTMKNAVFDGLHTESLLQACDTLGMPHIFALDRIQNVKIDVPRIWWDMLDMELYDFAKTLPENRRIRDKISDIVKYRIQTQMHPYKPVVRDIFAQFAKPQNVGFATHHMWETAHHGWVAIGDTTQTNDTNYYTKRAILAGVLFSSISFWMQDNDNSETAPYIDRRIDDALRLGKIKNLKNLAKFTEYLPFMNHPLKMRD